MTTLQSGAVNELEVIKKTASGYILTNGREEIFLDQEERTTKEFETGEYIQVFVYKDENGCWAATTNIPNVQIGKYGWAKVVSVKLELGVFVDIGINQNILVSKDDLPRLMEIWPKEGDQLFITLRTDKRGKLFGRLATDSVMKKGAVPAPQDVFNQNIQGIVYRLLKVGSFLITAEGYVGFIHESQRKREPRLGELVYGRVIDVKEDGSINVSLLPRKHESIDEDAKTIFAFLESRGGAMPYSDKSHPEDIQARFQMSKAAFKRALGRLMKENQVYQEDGWTYIKK
jgi:uncharacterized protein